MRGVSAVVMAAGEGRRMRPLTERWPKPILPIDGRPVVVTLVRELAAAGFERAALVVGHLGGQIEDLLGDGSAFGLRLAYVRQPEALGSADAVRCALETSAAPPLLVVGADTVFARGDLGRAAEHWLASGAEGGLGVRPVPRGRLAHQTPVRVEGGHVVRLGGSAQESPEGVLTGAPVWFLSEGLAGGLRDLPGPPYELGSAFRNALAAGRRVAALELGPTRDVTRPADVLVRNFPYLSRWGRGETGSRWSS
jgi:N-acetyl-alpha-D-muramate 1-phosphate uridylyltransferase